MQRCATAIEAERAPGRRPAGVPARDLAVTLNSMNERVLYATFSGDGPAVAEADVVDVLLEVWLLRDLPARDPARLSRGPTAVTPARPRAAPARSAR